MAGGKETPRQKMIGMMYLVLTALLALNVSKEILNAFVAIEESLNTTYDNFEGKNKILYDKFQKALEDNKGKAQKFYDNAQKAKKYSKEVVAPSLGNVTGKTYSYYNVLSIFYGPKLYINGGNYYYSRQVRLNMYLIRFIGWL